MRVLLHMAGAASPPPADPDHELELELRERQGRDAMLVIAAAPLRDTLVELARSERFDVHPCPTPLAACHALARVGARVAYALIASDPAWGSDLGQLLADEYPEIEVILLAA